MVLWTLSQVINVMLSLTEVFIACDKTIVAKETSQTEMIKQAHITIKLLVQSQLSVKHFGF